MASKVKKLNPNTGKKEWVASKGSISAAGGDPAGQFSGSYARLDPKDVRGAGFDSERQAASQGVNVSPEEFKASVAAQKARKEAKFSPAVVTSNVGRDAVGEVQTFYDDTRQAMAAQSQEQSAMKQAQEQASRQNKVEDAKLGMEQEKIDLARQKEENKAKALQMGDADPMADPTVPPPPQGSVRSPYQQRSDELVGGMRAENQDYQQALGERMSASQRAYDEFRNTTDRILSGSFPLSGPQKALLKSTASAFDQMMRQAELKGRAVASATGGFSNKVTATLGELSNIESRKAMTLADIEQGFADKNYKMVYESYKAFQEHDAQQTSMLKELHNEVSAQLKYENELIMDEEKKNYDRVVKPIQDLAQEMLRNGAPQELINQAMQARTPEEALSIGGEYIGALERQRVALEQARFGLEQRRVSLAEQEFALKQADLSSGALTDAQVRQIDNSPQGKKLTVLSDLNRKMSTYKSLVGEYGFSAAGADKALVDNAYNELKIAWKDAAGLGALTGPDVSVLEGAIKPASGVSNYSEFLLSGGKDGVTKALDKAMARAQEDAVRQYKNLTLRNPAYGSSEYVKSFIDPFAQDIPDSEDGLKSVPSGDIIRTPEGFYLESLGNGEFTQI